MFFFIIFFVFFLYFNGELLETINLEVIIGFIVVGTAFFVISLWGLTNEERRGTKDEGKKLYVTYSIMTLWIFSLVLIVLGLSSFNIDNNSSTVVLHINEFWGIIYIPVGLLFFSLSTIKLWKIKKKQKSKKILPFFMEGSK